MNDKTSTLKERFGPIPDEYGFKKKMRMHQGWWRTNVLNVEPGRHPTVKSQNVCNTILNGDENGKNFLTSNVIKAVKETLAERNIQSKGIILESRLFDNLLTSQSLCFNFFGELYVNHALGLDVLKTFYPDLTKLLAVHFEFDTDENYVQDGSAFDVAFEVEAADKKGLIGFECKYTDKFTFKPSEPASAPYYGDIGNKNHNHYFSIFEKSSQNFLLPYYDYVRNKDFNQLFRNQLIAEELIRNKNFDFVRTGLFCHHHDKFAIETGTSFKNHLSKSEDFAVITYQEYISNVQRLQIDWSLREWTMLLWARYCATILSFETTSQFDNL